MATGALFGKVTTTVAERLEDTLPARSLAQAYICFDPADDTICVVGTGNTHPETATGEGLVDDSVIIYPVTPNESVASNVVIGIVREEEVVGMVKEVIRGAVSSPASEIGVKLALIS